MTTHTLGPWVYDGVRVYAPAAAEKMRAWREDGTEVEHSRGVIALVVFGSSADGSREANARLITAAPMLLRTLKTLASLAEALDIGLRERLAIRSLIDAALEEAEDLDQVLP